jgi:ribosomal-protein-alanine N-acetyltransferase
MNYLIRKMDETDLDSVFAIENESTHDTWDIETFRYAIYKEDAFVLINDSNNEICGFLFGIQTLDEYSISNIAIKEKYKRQGLAFYLISQIISAKPNHYSFFLEVRKTNLPAIKLYEKLGFKNLYIRKSYYHNPTEDAIVMGLIREKESENE